MRFQVLFVEQNPVSHFLAQKSSRALRPLGVVSVAEHLMMQDSTYFCGHALFGLCEAHELGDGTAL